MTTNFFTTVPFLRIHHQRAMRETQFAFRARTSDRHRGESQVGRVHQPQAARAPVTCPRALYHLTGWYGGDLQPSGLDGVRWPVVEGASDWCVVDEQSWTPANDLRQSYERWCEQNGERAGAGRSGQHPGQVEDANARQWALASAEGLRGALANLDHLQQRDRARAMMREVAVQLDPAPVARGVVPRDRIVGCRAGLPIEDAQVPRAPHRGRGRSHADGDALTPPGAQLQRSETATPVAAMAAAPASPMR